MAFVFQDFLATEKDVGAARYLCLRDLVPLALMWLQKGKKVHDVSIYVAFTRNRQYCDIHVII